MISKLKKQSFLDLRRGLTFGRRSGHAMMSLGPLCTDSDTLLDVLKNSTLGSGSTFLRGTTAYYTDPSTGILTEAGVNVPRFEAGGLLMEGESTNLVSYPVDFDNAWWTKGSNVVLTTDAAAGPDGATTAEKYALVSNTLRHVECTPITGSPASLKRTFSVYLWPIESAKSGIVTWYRDTTQAQSNAFTTAGFGAWERLVDAYTYSSTAGTSWKVRIHDTSGTNSDKWFMWGAKVESGVVASSFRDGTREADSASWTLPGAVTSWMGAAKPFTAFLKWAPKFSHGNLTTYNRILSLAGDVDNLLYVGSAPAFMAKDKAGTVASVTHSTIKDTVYSLAVRSNGSTFKVSVKPAGGSWTTGTAVAYTGMDLGVSLTINRGLMFPACFGRLRIVKRELSDAQLDSYLG